MKLMLLPAMSSGREFSKYITSLMHLNELKKPSGSSAFQNLKIHFWVESLPEVVGKKDEIIAMKTYVITI